MMGKVVLFLLISSYAVATDWQTETARLGDRSNLPKGLLFAIVKVESNFKSNALNGVDNPGTAVASYGIGQLTSESLITCGIPFDQRYDARLGLRCAVRLLKGLYAKYTSVEAAISGYNDGTPCRCRSGNWVTPLGKNCPLPKRKSCTPKLEGTWRNQRYVTKVLNNIR